MNTPIVILDACVLFPAPLRDFLMHLCVLDVFQARWTNEIHAEWIRNVLKIRPDLTERQLKRTRDLMNRHVRDCLVGDYQFLIDKLSLPDEVRPVIYSEVNKNFKIEVSSRLGSNYPDEGKPIIVLKEVGVRNFLYMLILPDDEPFSDLREFLENNPSVGKGLNRVITDSETLAGIWNNCPLAV